MNGDREKAWNSLVAPCTGLLGAVAALGLSGASLAGVSCAVALVACGAVGGWIAWRPRRTAPDELLGLIAEFEAFSAAMAPVWSGQIESSRGQMEEAIAQLSARFANIVQQLSRTLDQSARDGAGPGDAEAVYARSQAQLQELVGSLREAMQGKAQMLAKIEDLQRFVGELQDMAEAVARIAQQTNLLAINATIEAAHAGERGRGFAQVAQEVRSLSQMSGDTGRRIIAAINAIHSAINETRAAAQLSQNQEHRVMADSESRISQVLEQFRHLTDHLAQSADLLRHDSRQIQLEVNDSLVQLQFQDRVSQVLSHVRDNIGRMPSVVQNHHALCASEGALRPLDAGPLLQELEATYAMASERAVHRAGSAKTNAPAPAQHEEITFF